jgi:hypothetical protein
MIKVMCSVIAYDVHLRSLGESQPTVADIVALDVIDDDSNQKGNDK